MAVVAMMCDRSFDKYTLLAIAGFMVLSVVATWPLARYMACCLPSDLGDPLLNAWILGWDADRMRHAFVGLWDAPSFYPYARTLTFSEHLLGIAVPVAPIVWATGSPVMAHNVSFIGSFALAATGAYLLVRRLTGSTGAAVIAGLAFGFCPLRAGQVSHVQMLMTGWMPISLWALHGYLASGERRALAAFLAAALLQVFSNLYFIFFLVIPIAAVSGHALWRARGSRLRRAAGLALSLALLAGAIAPVATIYARTHAEHGLRRTERDVQYFAADAGSYFKGSARLESILPLWRVLPQTNASKGESELFPGLTVMLLALVAAAWPVSRRSRPDPPAPPGPYDPPGLSGALRVYAVILFLALWWSLGAEPTAWGVPVPLGGPYRWLFAHVPGFDGLRVPARMSVVVSLALAVLAGISVARSAGCVPQTIRRYALAFAALLVFLEGCPRGIPLARIEPADQSDLIAYRWIRDRAAGPLLELPIGELDSALHGFIYQFRTLFHHQRLVNGSSGYESALQAFLGGAGSPLLDFDRFDESLRLLRAIGVRAIVVHLQHFRDPALGTAIVEALRQSREWVSEQIDFHGLVVFRLDPTSDIAIGESATIGRLAKPASHDGHESPEALRSIPWSAIRITANREPGRLGFAFDGDLDTRWISGRPQSGDEIIELTFGEPRNVALIRFETSARSRGDYPRELAVEVTEDAPSCEVLWRGGMILPLGLGLVRDPVHGPADVRLPPNRIRRLRLRQLGRTRSWFWAIDELSVWERNLFAFAPVQ